MKNYKCHKVVQAARIIAMFISAPRTLTLTYEDGHGEILQSGNAKIARYVPVEGDYLVRYSDGYEAFSPAAAFEEGYHEIEDSPRLRSEVAGENTYDSLLAEMRKCGATGWVWRLRQLREAEHAATPVLRLDANLTPVQIEEFKERFKAASASGRIPDLVLAPAGDEVVSIKPPLPTRITREALEAMFRSVNYDIRPDMRTTVCEITFHNGFSVRGESSAACLENFKVEVCRTAAYAKALDKAWELAGFLLREDRHRAGL